MQQIYTRNFRVRFGELDANGFVRPSAYFGYLIETAWGWSESLGWGLEEYEQAGINWVILETAIELFHPLRPDDELQATIWLMDWRYVRGTRAFEMKAASSGQIVARVVQKVASVDYQTLRPTPVSEEIIAEFRVEAPRQLTTEPFPSIPNVSDNAFRTTRVVDWAHLDSLGIVFTPIYVDFVESAELEALAVAGWSPKRLREAGLAMHPKAIHLKHLAAAVYDDRLEIASFPTRLEDDRWTRAVILGRPADGVEIGQCVATWTLIDRIEGRAIALPGDLRAELARRLVGGA